MNTDMALVNHVMPCPRCYPASDRYCEVGRELWIEDKVSWFCEMKSKDIRRHEFEIFRLNTGDRFVQEIKKRVVERHYKLRVV